MNELTVEEVAIRLGVTRSRVRQLILDGHLPAEKKVGAWFIKKSDLRLVTKRRKPGRPKKETK